MKDYKAKKKQEAMKRHESEKCDRSDGYAGTYYSQDSLGVYHFVLNEETGELTEPRLYFEAPDAKWVSLSGDVMAIPVEREKGCGTCFLNLKKGWPEMIVEMLAEKQTPCYILQEEGLAYTANYHEGTVMIYDLRDEKPSLIKRIENGEEAGCHQILLHGSDLLVPCLVRDRIRFFDREHEYALSKELIFPKGTGPRHGIFSHDHSRFYVVGEWSNELFIYQVQGRNFQLVQTLALLPENSRKAEAASAAIRMTADERFLYISIRGLDLLAVVDISREQAKIVQHASCYGVHPRDCILSRNEKFLLAINRYEGGIVSIRRDEKDGKLREKAGQAILPQGVSLVLK